MQKLLDAYRAHPSLDRAYSIIRYDRAHPMAACLLPADDLALFNEALAHAQNSSLPILRKEG